MKFKSFPRSRGRNIFRYVSVLCWLLPKFSFFFNSGELFCNFLVLFPPSSPSGSMQKLSAIARKRNFKRERVCNCCASQKKGHREDTAKEELYIKENVNYLRIFSHPHVLEKLYNLMQTNFSGACDIFMRKLFVLDFH